MIDIFGLESAIKTKIETISNFVAVYDHFTLKTEGYPYAAFELSNFDGQFADVCSNFRDITFNMVIIQNISKDLTRDAAKNIIYKILEKVIDNFDGDMTLGDSNVIRGEVLKGDMGTFLSKEGDVLALTVEIKLTVNNSII